VVVKQDDAYQKYFFEEGREIGQFHVHFFRKKSGIIISVEIEPSYYQDD